MRLVLPASLVAVQLAVLLPVLLPLLAEPGHAALGLLATVLAATALVWRTGTRPSSSARCC